MSHETFRAARGRLLDELHANGWTLSRRDLKVPHATLGADRVWFKPQALYASAGLPAQLKDAWSVLPDYRELSYANLLAMLGLDRDW